VSALYFGGISLACEPGAEAYAALLANEGSGRAVMLDPNIRTGFIEDAERYRVRLDRMIAVADIVKISDEDLDWIAPGAHSLEAKARTLLETGPALVILTQGSEGATGFLRGGAEVHAPAEKVEVVDTVGAGDTFNAGVLAKLSEHGALRKDRLAALAPEVVEQALRFGARVAAVTVSRAGANPPWADEL
ncbi:MAG: carbohydrate kinase, partial [Litoreibacter sp.]|nr:carbohydrate kinase [Litoreibacter sp.]